LSLEQFLIFFVFSTDIIPTSKNGKQNKKGRFVLHDGLLTENEKSNAQIAWYKSMSIPYQRKREVHSQIRWWQTMIASMK